MTIETRMMLAHNPRYFFYKVTVILVKNENLSYLANIKHNTLQAVSKQLLYFDEASCFKAGQTLFKSA